MTAETIEVNDALPQKKLGVLYKTKRNDWFPMLMVSRKFSLCAGCTQSFLRGLQKSLNLNIILVNMYIYRRVNEHAHTYCFLGKNFPFSLYTHMHTHAHRYIKEQTVQNMHVVKFYTIFILVKIPQAEKS